MLEAPHSRIIQASLEDAAEILALQKLAYQVEGVLYRDFNIPPLTQTFAELKHDFTTNVFLKVECEEKLIGSVRAYQTGETCYIQRLVVHPDFQGRSIGTALMIQIESVFEQVQRFELFTGHKSDRNIWLYDRLGYKIFKREVIHENLSFVFMEKYSKF